MVYIFFIIIFLNKFLQNLKEWMALIAKEIFDPAFGLF